MFLLVAGGGLKPVASNEAARLRTLSWGRAVPQIFFTELAALCRPVLVDDVVRHLPVPAVAAVEASGASDGMPFILDNHGRYDQDLNRFFRACPTMGVRSRNSLRAYGRDLVVWMRFLSERRQGKTIWQVDREDVAASMRHAVDWSRSTGSPPRPGTAQWRRWRSSMAGRSKKS